MLTMMLDLQLAIILYKYKNDKRRLLCTTLRLTPTVIIIDKVCFCLCICSNCMCYSFVNCLAITKDLYLTYKGSEKATPLTAIEWPT